MNIKYYLADPTKNMTVLVDTPVDDKLRPELATFLMELEPTAEQVGFVNGARLQMAGGEFCGNATMSAAALYCEKNGLSEGESVTVELEASGVDGTVRVKITAKGNGEFVGTVRMPKPLSVRKVSLPLDGEMQELTLVDFSGLSHIVTEHSVKKETAETAVRQWCDMLEADAFGLMQFDREKMTVIPLVYVKNPETLFWESSCASGTTAVCEYLAGENDSAPVSFSEPGGELTVEKKNGSVLLTGTVKIIKENTVEYNKKS